MADADRLRRPRQGQARPIKTIVRAIIDDLKQASSDGTPHLDVIVATHHHADHISGFSLPDWDTVDVGEVWLPFVADPQDPDTRTLTGSHDAAAETLHQLITAAGGARRSAWPAGLRLQMYSRSTVWATRMR